MLLIVFIVLVGIAIVRWLRAGKSREDALVILKKRYANGEIGKEEYERMRKDVE